MPDTLTNDYDETPEALKEFIDSAIAELPTDRPPEAVAKQIAVGYGLDVTEVSDDDAETFVQAVEEGDADAAADMLSDYGLSDAEIQQFKSEIMSLSGNADPSANGSEPADGPQPEPAQDAPAQGADGAVSRQEVEQMIENSVPSSAEIANDLRAELSNGGGGGNAEQGGQDQLAQLISLAQLATGGSGGGQMAEIGEQFQKAAMESYLQKLNRPTLGEMVEMKMYENMSDDLADQWQQEVFGEDAELGEGDDDDDDDGKTGGLLSW